MTAKTSLANLLESFFRDRLPLQRNATRATIASYRDALRLLVLFASKRTGRKPCALTLQDLDRDLVLAYLDHLEKDRSNCTHTRNSRLTAVRSFFHHVAANDPAAIAIAQRILSIPIKKSNTAVTHYLSRSELDALIDAPDSKTPRGRRERVLLLFLARTGARISEALGVDAADLQLIRPKPQVLLRGKGRKQRMVPLAEDLAKALELLLQERGVGRHDSKPLFVGTHGRRLTRFGATHIVRRAASSAFKSPQLAPKLVSPHVLRHYVALPTMSRDLRSHLGSAKKHRYQRS